MTVLIILAVIGFWGGLAAYVYIFDCGSGHRTPDDLRTDLLIADQRIGREHRQARRAMNDAAGQSWRNLAG